jgi:hypothetical protein
VTILIKLFYAGAITTLLILFVAFGIRTFYPPPEEPQFAEPPIRFRPVAPITPGAPEPELTPEQLEFEEAQRRFQEEYRLFEEERQDYRRNVFLVASAIGIVAVAAGLALPSMLDAIRLGLVSGGLGTVLYAVIQAEGDLDNAGPTVIFLIAAIGLVLVLVAGYRWLATRPEEA